MKKDFTGSNSAISFRLVEIEITKPDGENLMVTVKRLWMRMEQIWNQHRIQKQFHDIDLGYAYSL